MNHRPTPTLSLGWSIAALVAALGLVAAGIVARSWWAFNIGFVGSIAGAVLVAEHFTRDR